MHAQTPSFASHCLYMNVGEWLLCCFSLRVLASVSLRSMHTLLDNYRFPEDGYIHLRKCYNRATEKLRCTLEMALRTFTTSRLTYMSPLVHVHLGCQDLPATALTLNVSRKSNVHVLSGLPPDATCTLRCICDQGSSSAGLSFRITEQSVREYGTLPFNILRIELPSVLLTVLTTPFL